MSYNNNFYNATFHNTLPPPPPPPACLFSPLPNDRDIVNQFESRIVPSEHVKVKPQISISSVRNQICNLLTNLNNIKLKQQTLTDKVSEFSDEEWCLNMREIEENKQKIKNILAEINRLNFDVLKKLLAKRSAKRCRMKRVGIERKREKEERVREMKERSRKIDENLQKIKDDITKAKQEKESKLQADIVLRETLRKKHDAKKCIEKLEAMLKLRRARQNTAKGRGESVTENEGVAFENNIGNLKSLWTQKLALYESEELELRDKLSKDSGRPEDITESEKDVYHNLNQWKDALFGGDLPQVDFQGDVGRFLAVRSQWDQYIHPEGTPIPIGWIPPSNNYTHTHAT